MKNMKLCLDNVTVLRYNSNSVTKGCAVRETMNEELISKKELLERYGISYGTLYRWQRTGLIPKEWFIRKSTETGQETFFPKDLIIERVNRIFFEKDERSLEDLAKEINGRNDEMTLIIETKYGEQKIRLDDIKGIKISGAGKTVGINEIVEFMKNGRFDKNINTEG